MGVNGRAAIKRSAALLDASAARKSTSDVDPFLGHDLDNLAHITEVLLVRLKALEDRLNAARLADHCLLYTSPSPRDVEESRMPSSA